jgi:D-sedoheptulose 7-phosphate isomerase
MESFAARHLRETAEIAARMETGPLERAADLLLEACRRGHKVFTIGNGGSAAAASHLAADLAKYTAVPGAPRFRALCLGDNVALTSALTNDLGFASVFSFQLEAWCEPGDVLVCLSVHGGSGADAAGPWSQNLLAAARLARARGASVIAIVGFDGGALRALSDVCVLVPSPTSAPSSTPHVEGFHAVVHHLLCADLRARLEAHTR